METCTHAYNLTDCILLSVLDSFKDHNRWDVPTFVVTLVIGLVALTFPCLAFFQAFYGPGRRRCSEYAIGKWRDKTKFQVNWSEFRRDSIAHTPLLTASAIDNIKKQQHNNKTCEQGTRSPLKSQFHHICLREPKENKSDTIIQITYNSSLKLSTDATPSSPQSIPGSSSGNKDHDTNKNPEDTEDNYILATWLKLFTHLDVVDFVWKGPTRQTPADYLSSEIQAAPAYMDVDTIVVLAAAAGCHTLTFEPESEYPLMTGRDIQIRFRRDSYLGVVASFQQFISERLQKYPRTKTITEFFDWLASSLERSHGKFQAKVTDPDGQDNVFVNVLDFGSEPITVVYGTAQPHIKDPNLPLIKGPALSMGPCPHIKELKLCRCWTLVLDIAKQHNFSWLLYAEPMMQKEVFPAKSAKVESILGTVLVQGSFWSRNHLSDEWIFDMLQQRDRCDWKTFWTKAETEQPDSCKVFAICLHFAVDVSSGKKHFFRLSATQRRKFRDEMTEEMRRVDDRIKETDHNFNCTRIGIYIMSAALMMLEPYGGTVEDLAKKTRGYLPVKVVPQDVKIGDTPRTIVRLLRSIKDDKGEPLAQLYRLFVRLFDGCWGVEVDNLMQALFDLPSAGPFDGSHVGGKNPIKLMAEQHCPVTELLIYRTVLLATICLTSLDNSEVFERGIGSHIVPFL